MRFFEFQSGRVLLDGVDIRDYSQEELRKNIGLVLQDPFSIMGLSSPISPCTKTLVMIRSRLQAAFVDADSFIRSFRRVIMTCIRAWFEFFTGQRQLLAFARTVASQPKILILDEATANIDSETEVWFKIPS